MKPMENNRSLKKPKLYNILYLTVATAIAVAAMVLLKTEWIIVNSVLSAYFILSFFLLLRALFLQMKYNLYSYNTIFYIGFALFIFFIIISFLHLTVMMYKEPEAYTEFSILSLLTGSAHTYMIMSFPIAMILSVALVVSNISLLKHEGRSFVNMLGIILAFLLIGGFVFDFWMNYYTTGSQFEVMMHDIVVNTLAAVYLYFECMIHGAFVADIIAARREPELDRDFMIVLGCGINDDGTPTPLLKGRIDRAIAFYEKQKAETGKELTFITSGGQGQDEIISESETMKRYLLLQGIPESKIIKEDRSTNTEENMAFSKKIIDGINSDAKIAFSTTNYHVFRSGIFARRVKMNAVGIGAKTKWYFWPNAGVREFVGLLTRHKRKQAAILITLILIYVTVTLMTYLR